VKLKSIESTTETTNEQTPAPPRPKLLVLISKSSGNIQQRTNQDRAAAMLKGKFQMDDVEQIDGSDPSQNDRRNRLFDVSGVRGNYPQFFLENSNGDIKFLGDYEWIDAANETGSLSKKHIFADSSTSTDEEKSTTEVETKQEVTKESATTPTPDGTDGSSTSSKLIMLISLASGNIQQKTNQDRARSMVMNKFDTIEQVDGSDPTEKDVRNKLFGISGLRGKYPQFFWQDATGNITFLGDYDWIEGLNESGILTKENVVASIPGAASTQVAKKETPVVVQEKAAVPPPIEIPKATTKLDTPTAPASYASVSPTKVPLKAVAKSPPKSASARSPPRSTAAATIIGGKKMILLISNFGGGVKQKSNQFHAKSIFHSNRDGIVPEEIDAGNPFHKELRAQLFDISGIQENYPQIFLKDISSGEYTYVGGIEVLEKHNESGTLRSFFDGSASKENMPPPSTAPATKTTSAAPSKVTKVSTTSTLGRGGGKEEDITPAPKSNDDGEGSLHMIHIVVAVLGVAVGIGAWMSTRGRH
jgi:hypothetical protein